jgi:hypothetical protein
MNSHRLLFFAEEQVVMIPVCKPAFYKQGLYLQVDWRQCHRRSIFSNLFATESNHQPKPMML